MPLTYPQILNQWQRIHERGHEIGVHPGYATYQSSKRIKEGADTLRLLLESSKLDQKLIGGRQHFLLWSLTETATALSEAGMLYDSTLGCQIMPASDVVCVMNTQCMIW